MQRGGRFWAFYWWDSFWDGYQVWGSDCNEWYAYKKLGIKLDNLPILRVNCEDDFGQEVKAALPSVWRTDPLPTFKSPDTVVRTVSSEQISYRSPTVSNIMDESAENTMLAGANPAVQLTQMVQELSKSLSTFTLDPAMINRDSRNDQFS